MAKSNKPGEKENALPPIFEEAEEGQLTIDVYQGPHEFIVQSAVAGVKPEELNISITEDMVTIRGERHRDASFSSDSGFHAEYQECFWGGFSRTIILPGRVDPESTTAKIQNGVLTIRLPKPAPKARKKRIDIEPQS